MLPPTSASARALAPLTRWERLGLCALVMLFIGFGVLIEKRSAFSNHPMTDLQVYLRTAWAVRTGADLYSITDDNGWHYIYPPLFAILLVPFADAPAGVERAGLLPFSVSVALWYLFSLACLAYAVHHLANALEARCRNTLGQRPPRWSRAWWTMRFLPIVVCLPPIGLTLNRGQVNLLVLALLCGLAAALLRRKSFQAGWWLAGAICLKFIPAFLLLLPLWRRDGRCLLGCGAGLLTGLVLIPTLVFGPRQTLVCYQEWADVVIMPALGQGTDQSRAKELIEITATDSQSFVAIWHNTLYRDPAQRPHQPDAHIAGLHWLIGGLMTLLTLYAAGWRRADSGPEVLVFLGMLVLVMLFVSPVCHLHYFCLSVLLVMGLLAGVAERRALPQLGVGLSLLLILNLVANTLPHFPEMQEIRDRGIATYGSMLLWLAGMVFLWRRRVSQGRAVEPAPASLAA